MDCDGGRRRAYRVLVLRTVRRQTLRPLERATDVTEIPEHLLKRSRERRAALGLGGDAPADAGAAPAATPAATGAAATPAAAAPATPAGPAPRAKPAAAAAAPPPKPDIPVVAAAKRRSRIPFWAMAGLALLPLWMFMYVRAMTVPPAEVAGPMAVGAEMYNSCGSCHGSAGGGGAGRPLADGEVIKTFPHIEDQIRFVAYGTTQYNAAGITNYGNPDREGGPHLTSSLGNMPQFLDTAGGSMTDAQILAVVCFERHEFSVEGYDGFTTADLDKEFDDWCAPESPAWLALEGGATLAGLSDLDLTDSEGNPLLDVAIGDGPAEGHAPGPTA